MKKIYCVLIVLNFFQQSSLKSQINLVPNPSFEDTIHCPNGVAQVYNTTYWVKPTVGSSDYFNSCSWSGSGVNVPNAIVGYQLARTGNAYAGLYTSFTGSNYREYIQVRLDSVLKSNHNYCAKFYISLADTEKVACNNIGIYFSDTAVSSNLTTVLNFVPQITNNIFTNPLTDKILWTEVSGSFIALGGEQYITIGNFLNDANSDTVHVAGGSYPQGYYYIDDVSVMDCTGVGVEELSMNSYTFKLFPNPNNGSMNLEYGMDKTSIGSVSIYDIRGLLIKKYPLQPGDNNTLIIDETKLSNGVYYYKVIIDDAVKASDKIVIIKVKF